MSTLWSRRLAFASAIGLVTLLASSCVVPEGPPYGPPAIGADYYGGYGPYYYDDGWFPGYAVGPFHEHGHRPEFGRGGGHHAFHAAPAGRAIPSIPSGSRGGGGGGGHVGGGGRR